MPPSSQSDRRKATRSALIREGRTLFATRGFADVPADQIVAAAGVTRGALQHHFKDKRGLFQVVFEQLEAEIADELGTLVGNGEGPDLLRRALSAFLDICARPEVVTIALTDAPAVLGWKTWREIEGRYGLGLLTLLITEGQRAQAEAPPHVVAQIVLGALIEAALYVANADDKQAARGQVEASLLECFQSLV